VPATEEQSFRWGPGGGEAARNLLTPPGSRASWKGDLRYSGDGADESANKGDKRQMSEQHVFAEATGWVEGVGQVANERNGREGEGG